jgi:TRAP-type mannitol/chloroaromatic compound transport system permease small subunit
MMLLKKIYRLLVNFFYFVTRNKFCKSKICYRMEQFWIKVEKRISEWNEWIGRAVSWLTAILVLVVGVDVVSRYFFNTTKNWVLELEWYLFSVIFLLGAGYALKHDKHVRVDLFYSNFNPRDKAWVNLLGTLFLLVPWCLFVVFSTWGYAYESFLIRETSPNPGGLPALYLIKAMVPIGALLLLLQGVAQLIQTILFLVKKPGA